MTAITDKIRELEAQIALLKSLQDQAGAVDPLQPYRDPNQYIPQPILPVEPPLPRPYYPQWWYEPTCSNLMMKYYG